MNTYGIKISKKGKDVNTSKYNDLVFSSEYKTLRVKSSGSGSITDGSRLVTIPHNLGYVPMFMVHAEAYTARGSSLFSPGDYALAPIGFSGIITDPNAGSSDDLFAYADTTNLYIKAQENFGVLVYKASNASDVDKCYAYEDSGGYNTGFWAVGNHSIFGVEKGAIRFAPSGVQLSQGQSIYKAFLDLLVAGREGTGQVSTKIYGIDEDNTGDFNAGTPATARSKTTASITTTNNQSPGENFGGNVTAIVKEIIDRGGWSSGNKLGFIMEDNGTTSGNDYYGGDSVLKITPNETLCNYKYTIFLNPLNE